MIFELKTIGDFGIILTLLSILIIYFGKLIAKVRKIKEVSILNEGILGFSFLIMYALVPLLIIYCIINIKYLQTSIFTLLIGLILIIIQFVIILIYQPNNKIKTNWWFTIKGIFFCTISIGITYYFFRINNLFYIIISLIFDIILLTYIAIKKENKLK